MTEQELIQVRDFVGELTTASKLITYCEELYNSLETPADKTQFEVICIDRAAVLRCKQQVERLFKEIHKAEDAKSRQERHRTKKAEQLARLSVTMGMLPEDIPLDINRVGVPSKTIDNYLNIMRYDPYYKGFRFNDLAGRWEIHTFNADGKPVAVVPWDDTERAESLHHIETQYANLLDEHCHDNALRILKKERHFNPITSLIESLPAWDGIERCKTFLNEILKADNTPYAQAVSRMLFDGAIARAFNPGCKYDNVIVLVGTQGCGKTTVCECLALTDEYHAAINTVDDKAVETLRGKWIVEIGEMFAVTDAKSQDRVKSFITARKDDYRIPYDRFPNQYQRRCIFIGDTNRDEFLADPTGGRRWYPVKLHADSLNGARLNDSRDVLIEYIEQCYAEAYYHYKNNELLLTIPEELVKEAERLQREAQEIPWYIPRIEQYIRDDMEIGEKVHAQFLWEMVLHQDMKDYSKHSRKLALYLRNMPCLEFIGNQRFKDGTTQRAFRKIADPE